MKTIRNFFTLIFVALAMIMMTESRHHRSSSHSTHTSRSRGNTCNGKMVKYSDFPKL